jgi:hypothetical protein
MCRASLRPCDRQGLRVKRRWFGVGGVGIGASGLGELWVRRGRCSGQGEFWVEGDVVFFQEG